MFGGKNQTKTIWLDFYQITTAIEKKTKHKRFVLHFFAQLICGAPYANFSNAKFMFDKLFNSQTLCDFLVDLLGTYKQFVSSTLNRFFFLFSSLFIKHIGLPFSFFILLARCLERSFRSKNKGTFRNKINCKDFGNTNAHLLIITSMLLLIHSTNSYVRNNYGL